MEYLQYILDTLYNFDFSEVLNLIINGIPSILYLDIHNNPVYYGVLNLIINGIPSILKNNGNRFEMVKVLNLIINGIPSIPLICIRILILW